MAHTATTQQGTDPVRVQVTNLGPVGYKVRFDNVECAKAQPGWYEGLVGFFTGSIVQVKPAEGRITVVCRGENALHLYLDADHAMRAIRTTAGTRHGTWSGTATVTEMRAVLARVPEPRQRRRQHTPVRSFRRHRGHTPAVVPSN
jgi:hypothetical protein